MWPSRLGVSLDGREPLAAVPALAQAAEAAGAGTLWVASHLFLRDPITMAAVALGATRRLRVALMAMSPYAMHPVHIAMAAAALDELHPGRVVLCLGSGAPADREAAGIPAPHPVVGLREAMLICRGLLAGEAVRLDGRVFRLGGQRSLAAGPARVPIILAAARPGTLRLAGAVADGVLLSAGASHAYVRQCLEGVDAAAHGRRAARLGLVYAALAAPGADRADALAETRLQLAFVLRGAHHAGNLAAAGTTLDQARLYAMTQAGDWQGAAALITDEIVSRHAAAGSAAEIAAAIAGYRAAGLDEVIVSGVSDPAALGEILRAAEGG